MSTKKFKAVNAFIFAGSFSIGTMAAGFDLEKVLEMTDDMLQLNAFYFHKNYPNIPVILPKEWENDEYLDAMKKDDIDLMCCNCPCSSLSRINRNASVDGPQNVHFYRLFNIFEHVQPKTFVIENAPTLPVMGYRILKDMANRLGDKYRFTIIHDAAGNHNVAMLRKRTMVVGWRRDAFDKIPLINPDKKKQLTAAEILKDPMPEKKTIIKEPVFDAISDLYKFAMPNKSIIHSLALHVINKDACSDEIIKGITGKRIEHAFYHVKEALEKKVGYYDKSPWKPAPDHAFKSFATPQGHLHPFEDRALTANEMGRIMGFPDSFDWSDDNKECKVWVRQAICQGVPANFGKWICENVKNALEKKCSYVTDNDLVYQNNNHMLISEYSLDELNKIDKIVDKKKGEAMKINDDLTLTK